MMKLYNIYYIDTTYGDAPSYEGTTDNFEEWLKQHNKERWLDNASGCDELYGDMDEHEEKICSCIEKEDEFEVEEIYPVLFNGGSE